MTSPLANILATMPKPASRPVIATNPTLPNVSQQRPTSMSMLRQTNPEDETGPVSQGPASVMLQKVDLDSPGMNLTKRQVDITQRPPFFANIKPTMNLEESRPIEFKEEIKIENEDCFTKQDLELLEQINQRLATIRTMNIDQVCIEKSIITDNLDEIFSLLSQFSSTESIQKTSNVIADNLSYIKQLIGKFCPTEVEEEETIPTQEEEVSVSSPQEEIEVVPNTLETQNTPMMSIEETSSQNEIESIPLEEEEETFVTSQYPVPEMPNNQELILEKLDALLTQNETSRLLEKIQTLETQNEELLELIRNLVNTEKPKKSPSPRRKPKNEMTRLCEMILRTIEYHNRLQQTELNSTITQLVEWISKLKTKSVEIPKRLTTRNNQIRKMYQDYDALLLNELEQEDLQVLRGLEDYYRQKHYHEFLQYFL